MPARSSMRGGGRPPKFDEPRRPVTLTLPERTLALLAAVDADRASAIVKLADESVPGDASARRPVDLVDVAPGVAVILVGPSPLLRAIPWLQLAEVSAGRHLVTLAPGTSIESLEVALLDLLEALPPDEAYERGILEELRRVIGSSRRERSIAKFEMLYVRSPSERGGPSSSSAAFAGPDRVSARAKPRRSSVSRRLLRKS